MSWKQTGFPNTHLVGHWLTELMLPLQTHAIVWSSVAMSGWSIRAMHCIFGEKFLFVCIYIKHWLFLPQYTGKYRMKIFERSDFGGQSMELNEDCPDLRQRFHNRDISSANVMEGYWTLHEHPNYTGRQFFLRPGEYRRYAEWGSPSPTMGSLRRVTDLNWRSKSHNDLSQCVYSNACPCSRNVWPSITSRWSGMWICRAECICDACFILAQVSFSLT